MTPPSAIHKPQAASPKRSRASALMLMIWAILFMSLTVMGVVEYIGYSVTEATLANAEFRAAKEELLDAKKEAELSVILAKRDAIRAKTRQVRAAFSSPTDPSPAPAQNESQTPGNAAELSA